MALIAAGCSPVNPVPAPATNQPSQSAGLAASPSPPAARLLKRLPVAGITALAPSAGGVWYARSDGTHGWIGQIDSDGREAEQRVGPRPIAIATGGGSVYVAEAAGDDSTAARQNLVERIDPGSFKVLASASVGSPTDLTVLGNSVWVVTSGGDALALSASDLRTRGSVSLQGSGPAHIASAGKMLWVVNAKTEPAGYLLEQIDPVRVQQERTIPVEGGGTIAALAGGSLVWLATLGPVAGSGLLRSVDPDGSMSTPVLIGAPAGLVETDNRVWWASVDGRLGALDVRSLTTYSQVPVGTSGSALTVSSGLVWMAGDDLVLLQPSP